MTLASIVLAVTAARQDPGRAVHESVMTTLRAIDINHASLQRDVLRARAGLLPSYDPLVGSVMALRKLTVHLDGLLAKPELGGGDAFVALVEELRKDLEVDEGLVEGFKTKNALLQNSIKVFGQAMSDLYRSPFETDRTALVQAGNLANMMIRFSARPDEELDASIRVTLRQFATSGNHSFTMGDVETIRAHSFVILKVLPQVDTKIDAIQASRIAAHVSSIQGKYTALSASAESRSSLSRLVLGATSIALCLYIIFLVYRLQKQTDQLKFKLCYEQAVAEIKARMVDTYPKNFPAFMDQALERFALVLESDHCGFAIVDGSAGRIKESYQLIEGEYNSGVVIEYAARLVRECSSPGNDKSWAAREFRGDPKQYTLLSEAGSAIPVAIVGAALPEGRVAVLHVRYDRRQPKAEPYSAQMLQATLQTLVEFVDTNRGREQRDALEDRLEHAQRLEAIGTLAGGIAHEFNNVLGAMLGYGEMAKQLLRRPSPTRHYVEEILRSGMKAKHIVDQILTFSRKRKRSVKPFDVNEAIEDILPLLQVTLRREFRYAMDGEKGPAVIEGNPIEIHQIAMNLCRNAVEASRDDKSVNIAVSVVDIQRRRLLSHGELPSGRYVCMSVADEGPGIAEQALPHVFEPFFTTKSATGGTGLGLSAVHGIVTQMGGAINVRRRNAGGTSFDLYFPASELPPLPIGSFFDEHPVPTGKGERVAIVEADGALREQYEEKVAALGYEPLGFATVESLRSLLFHRDGERPDLVMVGQMAPGMEFATKELDEGLGKGRYLILSASARDRGREHPARPEPILRVPFSSSALAHALAAQLKPSA